MVGYFTGYLLWGEVCGSVVVVRDSDCFDWSYVMDMQARFAIRQAVVFTVLAIVAVAVVVYAVVPIVSFWVHFVVDYAAYIDGLPDAVAGR